MNNQVKPLSNRSLAKLLVTALVFSIVGTLVSFDQLGGFALFTGHAVADEAGASEDRADAVSAPRDARELPSEEETIPEDDRIPEQGS